MCRTPVLVPILSDQYIVWMYNAYTYSFVYVVISPCDLVPASLKQKQQKKYYWLPDTIHIFDLIKKWCILSALITTVKNLYSHVDTFALNLLCNHANQTHMMSCRSCPAWPLYWGNRISLCGVIHLPCRCIMAYSALLCTPNQRSALQSLHGSI